MTKKISMKVSGMTCMGCEEHVAVALENIGAKNVEASFRHGEVLFEFGVNRRRGQKVL